MTDNVEDFAHVAIARDLVRRPEIKLMANVLWKTHVTGPVNGDIPPIYITLAYQLVTNKSKRDLVMETLRMLG